MDDDLDAFFDDVDNAVKEVQETTDEAQTNNEQEAAPTDKPSTNAADDETAAAVPSAPGAGDEQRPPKRIKVTAASSVPVRSIVASSVPVISIAPPLPVGPPPPAAAAAVTLSSYSNGNHAIPIPPPPPPPNNFQNNNPPLPPSANDHTTTNHRRSAAGTTWSDPTLAQWPPNDFRLFVGNLAKDLKQHNLEEHFSKYPSFAMARIMYNKADGKSRGYGFVSVLDPKDCAKAIREMDQSWLGSRPIKVKLSDWKDRELKEVRKKGKAEKRRKKNHHF